MQRNKGNKRKRINKGPITAEKCYFPVERRDNCSQAALITNADKRWCWRGESGHGETVSPLLIARQAAVISQVLLPARVCACSPLNNAHGGRLSPR